MDKETKTVAWEEVTAELEKMVAKRNKEYNKVFNDARISTVSTMVQQYKNLHPDCTEDEVKKYVQDYLDQEPDEFQRNFRLFAHQTGTMFTLLNQIITDINDFKELYMACNHQKLQAIAQQQAKAIAKAKAEQAAKEKAQKESKE